MRKWIITGLVAAMLCSLFTVTASAASRLPSFVGVVMDGQKIWFPDAQAFVDENNRTLVPVRFIAEKMGANVGWEPKTMTVPIERDDLHIVLTIGDSRALVNGKEVAFDSKAITSGGRTFVPLRFVSEALGAEVNWDSPTSTVFISTQEDANAKYDEWGRLIRTTHLPKNAKDYPYILADVPNEAYEMAYPYSHPTDSKVSSVLYSTIPEFNKKNVDIWMSRLKTFGALWLNVDYKTIDDSWAQAVFATKVQSSNAELKYIRRYVDWVKENKIQIEGYLDPEPSMIYRNGFGDNYIRSKFRIKFVSFKESKDLLYDERFPNQQSFEKGIWYEGYTDISMSTNVGGDWGPTLKVSPSASLFYTIRLKGWSRDMNKLHKRFLSMLLACLFLFFSIPTSVFAGPPDVRTENGTIKFKITSTAATSSIKYRTVGWTVRRDQLCSNTTPKQCGDPRSGKHASFLDQQVRQVGQEPNPPIPGQPVTTYYEVSEALVTEGMWKAGMGDIKDNDDLYLYAIMVSIDGNGNVRKGPFYTLDEIKRAEPWAHPDDLDDYFGIHVPYRSAEFPVDVIAKTVNGKVIEQPQATFLKGKYKVGETIDHEFPETIEDNGKTYTIVRSYLSPKQDPTRKDWLQENPETNPKVRTRSFTVHLGGTDAVAEYAENNPVKAIYQKEDGTKLKEVDKGVFATGEEANHTFEGQITSGGQTYEIIRSYITNNNKPDEKLFVLEKGDPKLKERSILVGSGGSNFIGIYKIPSSVTVASRIEAPETVDQNVTEVDGDFVFEVKSLKNLKSYEITDIRNARLVQTGDKTGNLSGTSTSKTIPIKIPFTSGDKVSVQITVVVKDVDGNTGDSTSDHTVRKGDGGGEPQPGASQQAEAMEPNVSAVIQADARGAEKFDVLQGIPTSESLYVNALAKSYLYRNTFMETSGTKQYPIQVSKTYTLTWTETRSGPPDADGNPTTITVPRSDTQTVSKNYSIERKYSFWTIQNLEVYGIQKATVSNYALPSGTVTLEPNGYAPPTVSAAHDASLNAHIIDPVYSNVTLPGQTISGGSRRPSVPNEDWTNEAEKAIGKIKVKNDSFVFNGNTIMDNRIVEEKAPTPGAIPAPPMIGQDVLYGKGYLIDASKTNKANQPSTGTITYSLIKGIGGGANKTFSIVGINPVTVHTPVVNYASVSDDQAHNQKTQPTAGRSALILDRPFTVTIPTSGPHKDIKGYGNRDYAKYVRDKQVRFPFDVYKADRTSFVPKDTWVSIPVGQLQTTFYLPVWVDEGHYDVLFRTFAENSPASFTSQMNANLDLSNHVAAQAVPVEVIGRLYDFRITDIADFAWESVFRTQKGSATPTGNAYWVGTKGIDGAPRGNTPPYVLPVRQGSHPESGKKNVAVKTGYHFKFEVMTKGNMFGSGDGILITPTFYFVDSKGKNRQEVDLYYHSGGQRFIRIGSGDDVEKRYVTLDARLRNVPKQELTDTAATLWSLNGSPGARQTFIDQYVKDAQKPTYVGGYDIMLLPPQLRTFVGSTQVPSGIDAARANASVQRWRGDYSVPAAPYVVPKGFNLAEYGRTHRLDDNAPVFLKDGYIIVNFNIETIRNQDLKHPHLQYKNAPLDNQWRMEGFQRSFVDPYGATFSLLDGDVVFYHANLSSYDDYGTGGTH